jgi:DMSO/TMAO reductase YedYZ molybdopterin-dependent catalytic subunit
MKEFKIIFIFVSAILIFIVILFTGCNIPVSSSTSTASLTSQASTTVSSESTTKEVEATEFQGVKLTPINQQGNNALSGTQNIDRQTYKLTVDGLVENPLTLNYEQILTYPQESWLMKFNCVEGWNFTAKWTGPQINSILNDAKVKPEAKVIIFYTKDVPDKGYTSLDLNYIRDNNILLALKINDITLPPERGFPFQVVAKSKFGYKWAKWVVRMELSSDINFRGYWESAGYNNNADENGPAYESGK